MESLRSAVRHTRFWWWWKVLRVEDIYCVQVSTKDLLDILYVVKSFLHSLLIGDEVKNFHTLPPGLLVKCEGMKILYLQVEYEMSFSRNFQIFSNFILYLQVEYENTLPIGRVFSYSTYRQSMNLNWLKNFVKLTFHTLPIGRVFSYLHTLLICQEVEYENS